MTSRIVSALLLAISVACSFPPSAAAQATKPQEPRSTEEGRNVSYVIVPAEEKTWGYDVLVNGRRIIHQTTIPGVSGNKGFRTQADAGKVASAVCAKIRKGEMPPSITIEEMESLGVL